MVGQDPVHGLLGPLADTDEGCRGQAAPVAVADEAQGRQVFGDRALGAGQAVLAGQAQSFQVVELGTG